MIISTSLVSTPFVSSTDSTRLQMASKQLSQTVTHFNCRRPYIIGKEWPYLTNTTRLFRLQAPYDGSVLYSNNELMIILYDENTQLKTVLTPEYLHTALGFATRLRYKCPVGNFKKNDILYEYDNFIDGVPSYGYNINTAYFPFFGINFEDCIVISEYLSEKLRTQKIEKVIIPIYVYSLFSQKYNNSKYGFIPEVNQHIDKNVVAVRAKPTGGTNSSRIKSILRSFNIYDFSSIINDAIHFNKEPITTKIYDGKINDIKIHIISNQMLIDKQLYQKLELLKKEYVTKVYDIAKDISSVLGQEFTKTLISNNYILTNPKNEIQDISSINDLCYLVELEIIKDEKSKIGDKLSNRYAGKGVIGLIIPDDLRPYNKKTKDPIDIILGPLSIYSRSNFSTVLEGLLSKTIKYCEKEILDKNNKEHTSNILNKLSEIPKLLQDNLYTNEIIQLSNQLKTDNNLHQKFIDSILEGGLYFEVPNFCNANVSQLEKFIKTNFNIETNDTIVLKKELFKYIKEYLKLNIDLPNEDIEYLNIFNAPMYILKLQQLAVSKFTARDFGNYSLASKQPIEDEYKQNKGSHLGSMEFDALIAHNNIHTIREFHTVKSDAIAMKEEMFNQLTYNNRYEVPNRKPDSYTKLIIDSLMTFLSNN